MAEKCEDPMEVSAEAGDKKLKLRGRDIVVPVLLVLGTLAFSATALGVYFHHETQKEGIDKLVGSMNEIVRAVKETTASQKEATVAQREMTCLQLFDQKERQNRVEDCRRLSR